MSYSIRVDKDVPIPMRDGVVLRADVYRPAGDGRHPVLLGRTHYGKETWGRWIEPERTAGDGYAVVINDMRGQYASDGHFDPFATDADDGSDTVEWCADQHWSNGRAGMFGSSSGGFAQLLAATRRPTGLRAIAPMQCWTSFGRGNIYTHGGAFALFSQWWALLQARTDPDRRLPPSSLDDQTRERMLREVAEAFANVDRWHQHLPVGELPPLPREVAEYFYHWVERPDMDDEWAALDVGTSFDQLTYPGLHLAGWFDRFCGDTIRHFVEMRSRTGPDEQRLVVGPWPHGVPVVTAGPHRFYGPDAEVDVRALTLQFYDHWLRGNGAGLRDQAPVRIFVLGADTWRDADDWPLPETTPTPFYLHSHGHANAGQRGGTLDRQSPDDEPADSYVYDPDDPTPTDPALLARAGYSSRGMAANSAHSRGDVLVYDSAPLVADLEVIGAVSAELWAASSAPDTDWVVTLAEVRPDGAVVRLCDGMVRARYRDSHTSPSLLRPDEVYHYELNLRPIANLFRRGSRVRVELASASFPAFDRNLNTGGRQHEESVGKPAVQTVFHDRARPSSLVLPVTNGQ